MPIDTRKFAHGTSTTQRNPFGYYVSARVLCSDHKVRAVKRISATADTFFSVPCAVTVKGKTVSGYMTMATTTDSRQYVEFRAYAYGRNGHLLP